jgi:hypothetical protein
MSVYSLDSRSPEDILDGHPFLMWLVRMHDRKSRFNVEGTPATGITVSKRDFILNPLCSSRFGVMVEEDGALALAAQPSDLEALMEVTWASAAFARGLKGKDYLILNCKDLGAGQGDLPVPLRIFFEVSSILSDVLGKVDPFPSLLKLRPMMILGGIPLHSKGPAKAEIPLTFVPVA